MSYKVEIINKKDPLAQLEASKSSIKYLFNEPLHEKKFKILNYFKKLVKKIQRH